MASRFTIEAVFKALDQFSAPVAKMQGNLQRFTKAASAGMSKVNATNDKIAGGLKTAAIAASVAGIAGGAALFEIGKTGAEFDQAMANVGAVSLMTRGQVSDLEKEARRLGSTTKFSATQVAEGMELMGKAGFTNAEIIQTMPGVLAAAAAEGMDLAEAASHVSNVLKGMGLATSETSRVADVLTLASARTNSSISSLAESMKNVAPVARQFKVPFEDTVAAVALLQDVGIDASEAGTATATMLTKLAKPSKEAAAQMQALGIKFQDAKGNMLPFAQVLGQFDKASKKAGGNMKVAAFFAELVGLRGQKAALNLKDLFASGKVGDLVKELQGADGSAEKMAALRMDSFTGDITRLGQSVDALKIDLFDMNTGALRGVVRGVTEWTNANRQLIVQKVQNTVIAVKDNLPLIYLWLKRIAFGIVVFYAFAAAVKAAQVATAMFQIVLGLATFAGRIFGATIAFARVATTGMSLATIAASATTAVFTAYTWLRTAAIMAYNAVQWVGIATVALWAALTTRSTYATVATTAATWLRTAATTAYNVVVGAGTALLAMWNAGTLLSTARTVALAAATWLLNAANVALNAVMAINPFFLIGIAVIALIAYLFKLVGGWDMVKNAISGFADAAMAKIQPIIDKVKALFGWVSKAGSAVGGFLSAGAGAPPGMPPGLGAGPAAEVISPEERTAQALLQTEMIGRGEVTIRDESGKASVTKAPQGGGFGIRLQPSGAM